WITYNPIQNREAERPSAIKLRPYWSKPTPYGGRDSPNLSRRLAPVLARAYATCGPGETPEEPPHALHFYAGVLNSKHTTLLPPESIAREQTMEDGVYGALSLPHRPSSLL